MGEIKTRDSGKHYFQRGVTDYPAIGDPASLITRDELRLIYDISGSDTIDIGHLQQDPTIGAYINVDDMLSKHFAILGTTGVGKSSGVALILRQILEARPNLRIFLLDGHNEYARCFGDKRAGAQSAQSQAAVLAVQFRGDRSTSSSAAGPASTKRSRSSPSSSRSRRAPIRSNTAPATAPRLKKADAKTTGYTVDTPVPVPPRRSRRRSSTSAWASSRTARRA